MFEYDGIFSFLCPVSIKCSYYEPTRFPSGHVFIFCKQNGMGQIEMEMDGLKSLSPACPGGPRYYEAFFKPSLQAREKILVSAGVFNADRSGHCSLSYEFDLLNVGCSSMPINQFDGLVIMPERKFPVKAVAWEDILALRDLIAYGEFTWKGSGSFWRGGGTPGESGSIPDESEETGRYIPMVGRNRGWRGIRSFN